jgi:hypothetical protein
MLALRRDVEITKISRDSGFLFDSISPGIAEPQAKQSFLCRLFLQTDQGLHLLFLYVHFFLFVQKETNQRKRAPEPSR